MTNPKPDEIEHSAVFGEAYLVQIEYNTEADGSEVVGDEHPRTLHGPFDTEAEAVEWMNTYPDDTDVHDMTTIVLNKVK